LGTTANTGGQFFKCFIAVFESFKNDFFDLHDGLLDSRKNYVVKWPDKRGGGVDA
jgi:hypothetical protein